MGRADSLERVPANSAAIDDYLKTIYHHTEWQDDPITPSQLAIDLALAPSSVTEMVQKLAAQRNPEIEPNDTVAQTQSAVVLENLIGQFLTGRADSAGGGGAVAPAAGTGQ